MPLAGEAAMAEIIGEAFVVAGLTVIWMSSDEERRESEAVRRRMWVPAVSNETEVVLEEALVKVTIPWPDTLIQEKIILPGGLGRPSSEAVPEREAPAGRMTVWSRPAFTLGAWLVWFGAETVIGLVDFWT